MGILQEAWAVGKKAQLWKDARGQASAAYLEIKRLGWQWPSPFIMVTDVGVRLQMGEQSHKHFEQHMLDTIARGHQQKAAMSLRKAGVEVGHRLGAEVAAWAAASKKFSPTEKTLGLALFCKAYWTRDRFYEAGYDCDT